MLKSEDVFFDRKKSNNLYLGWIRVENGTVLTRPTRPPHAPTPLHTAHDLNHLKREMRLMVLVSFLTYALLWLEFDVSPAP